MSFSIFSAALDLLGQPRCPACDGRVETNGCFCDACAPLLEKSSDPKFAYEYGGPLADAIVKMKYESRRDASIALCRLFAEEAGRFQGHVDVVVHVPLHRSRLMIRGFDQAAFLARAAANELGVPHKRRWLYRRRATASQTSLDTRSARQRNVRAAFGSRRHLPAVRVLLVDDVMTTGATISAATEALISAGVVEVVPFSLSGVVDERTINR
ncbi:MAG: phosphoribosyltransferase family protein [Polyangiales bacterium]